MFESRLFFVDKLIDMGAQIILCDPHRATVIGHDRKVRLRATRMTSPDIRAGVALLIAAMSADGRSVIQNVEQIDRGYQNIDGRLNALGAKIKRLDGCGSWRRSTFDVGIRAPTFRSGMDLPAIGCGNEVIGFA